jgi:hypothetical protein
MMSADIAHALGEARREGLGWRCRCPLLNGQSRTRKRSGRGLSRWPASRLRTSGKRAEAAARPP